MSILEVTGEREDMGGSSAYIPESHYPMALSIGDTGVSDAKDDGGGNSPFVTVQGLVTGGPLQDTSIEPRIYFGAGQPGQVRKDGSPKNRATMLPWIGTITKKVTGKDPDETKAFARVSFTPPGQAVGEDAKAYSARYLNTFADHWDGLDPQSRLAFLMTFMRITEWNGKNVVGHVKLEESEGKNGSKFFRNSWAGFYALNDPAKGMEYVTKVAFVQQERAMR